MQWFPLKKLVARRITTLNSLINEHTRLGFWDLFSTIVAKFQPDCLLNSTIFSSLLVNSVVLAMDFFCPCTSLVLFPPCSITRFSKKISLPYFREQFPRKLFFFEFNLMYCDLWSGAETIQGRKLLKGGNYSRKYGIC